MSLTQRDYLSCLSLSSLGPRSSGPVQRNEPTWSRPLTCEWIGVFCARVALGCAFLSAVADRFGLWGKYGGWGNFANFKRYTAQVNSPWDSLCKTVFSRALSLVRRAICEGRAMIWGLHTSSLALNSLEQAFSNLLHEVTPRRGVSLRLFVQGRARALNPAIQEQLFLIGREAVMNALRHSTATKIEVEVQYLRDFLCLFVSDNGCGINLDEIQKVRNSLWSLRGMRDRAETIGAQFGIWSRPGFGTEVRVAVPVEVAVAPA